MRQFSYRPDRVFVFHFNEPKRFVPTTENSRHTDQPVPLMSPKKRSTPKPKTVILGSSAQGLPIRYAELLRLRQIVRQAEAQALKGVRRPLSK
jgi:hypothetical protein